MSKLVFRVLFDGSLSISLFIDSKYRRRYGQKEAENVSDVFKTIPWNLHWDTENEDKIKKDRKIYPI